MFDKMSKKTYPTYLAHYDYGILNNLDSGIMFHPRQDSYFVENEQE